MISDIKNEIDESEKLRTEAKTLLDNAQKKLDTATTVSNGILENAKTNQRILIDLFVCEEWEECQEWEEVTVIDPLKNKNLIKRKKVLQIYSV